ncbi:MAG: hypothetical protein Q8K91_07500 [Hylemonella sp.]|nr:hypothetical protein [Hylemonella sp.]MDP1937035.1 hypothetical protein [Hylemonella sp.]
MNNLSEVAGLHLSPHDLRRTFTTIGIANCDIDLFKIELLTNHVPKTVTGRHYLETQQLQYLLPQVQQIYVTVPTLEQLNEEIARRHVPALGL